MAVNPLTERRTTDRARSRPHRFALAICSTATAVLAVLASSTPAFAAGPTVVAQEAPIRLVQSTANLYWTSGFNTSAPFSAAVYRTGKNDTPGKETVLYREDRNDSFFFGDLTFANDNGVFYGYFAANYLDRGFSEIKRIPLAGGPAVTLATSLSPLAASDLVTDGSFLYWADAGGLRKMSISGGAITTLFSGGTLLRVALDATQVYFSNGAAINSVPKAGGGVVTRQVTETFNVSSIFTQPTSAGTALYWGTQDGSVKSQVLGVPGVVVHQQPLAGRLVKSVSFDGTRVLWTDCNSSIGTADCAVRKRQGGATTTVSTGESFSADVQGDATAMYWSSGTALVKFIH